MIFYNSLLGVPVFDEYKDNLGIIKEVAYSCETNKVLGLVVHEKGLFGKEKFIPIDYIKKFNTTNVIVDKDSQISEITRNDDIYKTLNRKRNFKINTEVYSKKGKKIGHIKDIAFDFETGLVDGFIIGNGVIQDIISGRTLVKSENTNFNKKVLIVNETQT